MDRTSRFSTVATAAFLTSLFTACGGGGGSSLPAAPSRASVTGVNATMRLTIPAKSSSATRAKYVSASTQSVVLSVNGTALPADNTTATSPGCSSTNGAVVCSFAFTAPVGTATIGVKAYDAPNGGGNLLSQGAVTQTLVAGSNVVPVALGGVTASLAVSAAAIAAGTAGATPVIVQAKDADGNVIVGPGNYSSPITVADADTTGITTLSVNGTSEGTSATVNGPNDAVVLNYNGKNLYSATLTPSASGVSNATAGSFAPALTYLATYQLPSVMDDLTPVSIAAGGDGNLWIIAAGDNSPGALFKLNASGTLTEFDPGSAPSSALRFGFRNIVGTPPWSAVAAWFSYSVSGGAPVTALGSITSAGVVTNYTITNWCGGAAGFMEAIVSDAAGGAWFGVVCPSNTTQIGRISGAGAITMSAVFPMKNGGYALALGRDGNIYGPACDVTCAHPGIFQAIVSGSAITGATFLPNANLGSHDGYVGIAQSDDGDFWMTDPNCPAVLSRVHLTGSTFASGVYSNYSQQGCTSPWVPFNGGNNTIWVPNSQGGVTEVIPTANQGVPTLIGLQPPLPGGLQSKFTEGVLGPDGALYVIDSTSNLVFPNLNFSGVITRLAY